MENKLNGALQCPLKEEWVAHKESTEMMRREITEVRGMLKEMHHANEHLEAISSTLLDMKQGLFSAVLGKEMTPIGITKELLNDQRKSYVAIIRTLCWAFGLILTVLIGIKYLAPHWFGAS